MNNWYENSIKSLIERYLAKHGYIFTFNESEYWESNLTRWCKSVNPDCLEEFIKIANDARSYAFNEKYGNYSYSTDYRTIFDDWHSIILEEIQKSLDEDLVHKMVLPFKLIKKTPPNKVFFYN